jgi:hypothetical protein
VASSEGLYLPMISRLNYSTEIGHCEIGAHFESLIGGIIVRNFCAMNTRSTWFSVNWESNLNKDVTRAIQFSGQF